MIEEKMGKELDAVELSWTTWPVAFKQILMELHESLDDNRGGMCSRAVEELTNCCIRKTPHMIWSFRDLLPIIVRASDREY